jgi:hypothetical protein
VTEHELAELVGRVGNVYTRFGLSPPSRLRDGARRWLGMSHDEIVAVIENHLADHRRLYTAGAGEQHFGIVQQAIRKAWEAKHPPREPANDAPVPPRRKRGVRQVYQVGGYPDAIDDREDGDAVGEHAEA